MMTDTRTPQEIARDYEDRLAQSAQEMKETRDKRFAQIFGRRHEFEVLKSVSWASPDSVATWPDQGAVPWKPDVLIQILEQTRRTDHKAALSTIAALAADALAERGE